MDNVSEIINIISQKLAVPAEQLWNALILQAKISAITSLITLVGVIVVFCILFIVAKKAYLGQSRLCQGEELFVIVIATTVLALVAVFGTIAFHNFITSIFNPEYKALAYILKGLNN